MNIISGYNLVAATGDLKKTVVALLEENDLPVSDLDFGKHLFALLHKDSAVGTGGLEFFGNCALLRSVSVKKDLHGQGLGKLITKELEEICKKEGINCLYLLTTTARDFFIKAGYEEIDRECVPSSIKNTSQFSSVCPSSAIVMRKGSL